MESKAKSEATSEEDLTQLHSSADNNVSQCIEPVQGIPSLSQFSGSNEQDGDAFDWWVHKLSRYAELESSTETKVVSA